MTRSAQNVSSACEFLPHCACSATAWVQNSRKAFLQQNPRCTSFIPIWQSWSRLSLIIKAIVFSSFSQTVKECFSMQLHTFLAHLQLYLFERASLELGVRPAQAKVNRWRQCHPDKVKVEPFLWVTPTDLQRFDTCTWEQDCMWNEQQNYLYSSYLHTGIYVCYRLDWFAYSLPFVYLTFCLSDRLFLRISVYIIRCCKA